LNLNHLAIFHAVALSSSVSGGAKRLHISQSAVSKQLGELEAVLELPLFDRLPRGVRLTEAGHILHDYSTRLFAIESEAERALAELKQLGRGRIAIGASRTIGAYMLPPVLARFHRLHPGVELSLQVENTKAIETKLIAGEIDIGFAEGLPSSEHLDYKVFARDQLVLVAAPDHPVAARSPLPWSALAGEALLMHEHGSGTRAVTERALAAKKLHLRPVMTLASSEAIKQTVATGAGLAFLSSAAIRTEVEAGILAAIKVRGMYIERPLYRMQLKKARLSPSLRAFLGLLEAHAVTGLDATRNRAAGA
jgi:DNA-binding transcriptional LysR family regulator